MLTCGEATMHLLAAYGVTTAFGIPGVHTLDMCRGLSDGDNGGPIRHIRARNEQGAGFMAEGWARATGDVGVAIVISGPGVTNATTALGQCYADSLPMLLISAEPPVETIGKGWGVLHEITEQCRVTEPLCAFSQTARCAADVPVMLARAFSVFRSERPRPVHISLPTDVQAEIVHEHWQPVLPPPRPYPDGARLDQAAALLADAQRPIIYVGGGATECADEIRELVSRLGCPVFATTAGKGIVPDDHPMSIHVTALHGKARDILQTADLMVVVGSEMSETDHFLGEPDYRAPIIRIDIDPTKINDRFPAQVGIVSDARPAVSGLLDRLPANLRKNSVFSKSVAAAKEEISAALSPKEMQHKMVLDTMKQAAPANTIWSGDPCQIVYTGTSVMQVSQPRSWFYPVGFCALGNAVPNAIGAKLACPNTPVVALVGDGGFMFTMPEIMTAVDQKLPLPIILWDNSALQQIKDGLAERGIQPVGVDGQNPDFAALALACQCHAATPYNKTEFIETFTKAFDADRPTLIVIRENDAWLSDQKSIQEHGTS
jgi:thiamine pyrophosphate-dependent acetolactate synthase large subunit-like protein